MCVSEGGDGSAAPGRRYLEVAKAFGENGIVTSICEDHYGPLFGRVIDRLAELQDPRCADAP